MVSLRRAGKEAQLLASNTIPEAYEEGGAGIGVVTTIGSPAAFVLGRLKE